MNKKVLTIVILVIVVLGIGGFLVMSKKTANAPSTQTGNQPTSAPALSSLKDLLAKGIAQSCTFDNNAGSKGTVYISDGKVRGDFEATIQDGTVTKTHMITSNNTSYIWVDGQATGFKMAYDPNATPAPATSGAPSQSVDVNAQMNYNCNPWVSNSSVFTPPSNIQFMTFAAPTQGGATLPSNLPQVP